MAKFFIDVVQNSPRAGPGIPVKTKNPSRTNTPPAEPPFGLRKIFRPICSAVSEKLCTPTLKT